MEKTDLPKQSVFMQWLAENEANTQQDHYSLTPYVVHEYRVSEKEVYVDYDFLVVDSAVSNFELFKCPDDVYPSQQFPKELCRVRLKERYIWNSSSEKNELSEDYLREAEDILVSPVSWDADEVTDSVIGLVTGKYDEYAFGGALVKTYQADKEMPSFIPKRLIPYFSYCISCYLNEQKALMPEVLAGFHLPLWESLNMSFNPNGRYSVKEMGAKSLFTAQGEFNENIFSLRINLATGHTLATVMDLHGNKMGNHIVSEVEAIKWFASFSPTFKRLAIERGCNIDD